MKLSKILLGICFVTAGQFFSSCSLDETPYTSLPMSDYFQTPENFGFYLDGVYKPNVCRQDMGRRSNSMYAL